jgi:hypothetical protein
LCSRIIVYTDYQEVAKREQFERDGSGTLAHMSTQTIAEYLDEERQKYAANQLRADEEAARIQPLQHGHHRAGKQARLVLMPAVKSVAKKKKKKKRTVAIARTKPRAAKKMAAKIRRSA